MIRRRALAGTVKTLLQQSPVVALLGPRQCGKTTLARSIARTQRSEYFDLEDPADSARLATPQLVLERLQGLVVIDEIQRKPDLFEILRVLADRPRRKTRFLVLGSASPHLVRGASESLAGRIRFVEMSGFDLSEVGLPHFQRLWLRGGMPRSFLASSEARSLAWRNDFVRTFLERDIPQLGISIPSETLRRFWTMVAHYHGQVWNGAEFARALGSSEPTARRHLDLLTGAYVVRQIQPWFENTGKRQVKSPKIYVRDSGLLHALLTLRTQKDLMRHPKYGASWEGFAIEQILSAAKSSSVFFWGTHGGAELDFLLMRGGRRFGFEMKCVDAPRLSRSMHVALEDLSLTRLYVVYPGTRSYPLHRKAEALALADLPSIRL